MPAILLFRIKIYVLFVEDEEMAWACCQILDVANVARRLARMVQHPAVADVSKALWSYASPSQVTSCSPLCRRYSKSRVLHAVCCQMLSPS